MCPYDRYGFALRSDFSSVEQLEVIRSVLADRAYKILGQLVSLVDIAADFANPTLFRGGGCLRSGLRLGLYIREIIRVGDRRDGGKNFRFGYVGNKQRVGARILLNVTFPLRNPFVASGRYTRPFRLLSVFMPSNLSAFLPL